MSACRPRRWWRTVWHDRQGNVALLFAGALAMLLGVSALGIDTATLFLEKRRLQGVADIAALAAAADIHRARPRADAVVQVNAGDDTRVAVLDTGAYEADPAIAADARFALAPPGTANAARVTIEGSAPTYFGRIFGINRPVPITARATAARIDLASFWIGSRLAGVGGGLPSALLSSLAGTDLDLTVMDYNALVGGRVDLLRTSELLRAQIGVGAVTFRDALSSQVALPVAIEAMAGAASDAATAQALRRIAARVPDRRVRLSDIIDLGPLGDAVRADPAKPISVDGFALLRETLGIGLDRRQVSADIALGIPGIAATRLWLEIGERRAGTPWLAVSAARRTTVRTAQTRLWVDVRLASAPLGLGAIRVPLFVELAEAQATLASVGCAGGRANAAATLDVTPALGSAAIADLDPATLGAFTRAVDLSSAKLVAAPLVTVTGYSHLRFGGTHAQAVAFSASDIDAQTVKTVSTNDIIGGVAASLLRGVTLRADVIGIGLSAGTITATVGAALAAAAPALDTVVDQVTAIAGVRVGQADVAIAGVRCGAPVLVG